MENLASQYTVLVVDDVPTNVMLVQAILKKEGYTLLTTDSGAKALRIAQERHPNLILLDIMLPKLDGWQVCREIRKTNDTPIIMLTAKGETFDKVLGLELGADDYMIKPFDSKELVARVKAVLRRYQLPAQMPASSVTEQHGNFVEYPDLIVNLTNYSVLYKGHSVDMPPKELEVLYFLASHVNQLFTRGQLLDQVWGFQVEVESRTVDVHVKRLRDKLVGCEKYGWRIQTIWGRGYKFEVMK